MGKRKERRLAAKTAVNRRVKLDLLAEPSGDFGDSSNKEEIEGGESAKSDAGSPTSSGQNPENPLLLLGQYSDEEMEEDSGKEISHGTGENSPTELDEQVKIDSHGGAEADKDANPTAEITDQENKEDPSLSDVLPNTEENVVIEDNTVVFSHKDTDAVDQTSMPWTSDTQTGDADSGWKMVLHEESNSYYYWNTVTGETSWEVPVDLGQGIESAYDPKSVDTHLPSATQDAELQASVATQLNERPELEVHHENHTDIMSNDVVEVEGNNVNTIDDKKKMSPDGVNYDSSDEGLAGHSNDALSNKEVNHTDSYHLLQLGENLSERLKSLKRENDQVSKMMIELDIRLADIKSLVPYGSSLLPFWLHSENHLRKLETAINNEILEHSQFSNTGETNEAENKLQENINEATADENGNGNGNAIPTNTDDDMDVEMEVEDESRVQNGPQSEEDFEVPPPPNDEWVPPPPPDDEPLPPPPPDEPSEAPFPPPQAYTYGEQYSFTYPGPSFDYYGQQVQSHDYYVDANGCQVAAPVPTLYYAPVPNPYSGGTPVVDPGEPVTYYTLQEGSVPTAPVIGSESVTSTVSAPTEPVPKGQPKAVRNKKRTVATVPGLRSNKKVSGLVDKWKAVKEELHEDEEDEEPENPLEVLEKKRQREIEQWRAQQIATGEAKDNANFQPLGGDWRERVRRKRAKKSTEAEEDQGKGIVDTNQKPDLVELSKQLPSGWQAYWDEGSKQVYYGNSKTSETTWTKPKPTY